MDFKKKINYLSITFHITLKFELIILPNLDFFIRPTNSILGTVLCLFCFIRMCLFQTLIYFGMEEVDFLFEV